jgi:farnesol dehydrogenase
MNRHDTILITGSNGFIGTWLVKKALDNGCRVRAVARNGKIEKPPGLDWGPDPFASPQLEIVRCDITDRAAVARVAEGCTHVFHLAGLAKNWAADVDLFRRVNVEGTRNILEAAKQAGATRTVFTSSAATLGASAPGKVHDESTPRISDQPFHEYEATKLEAERVALQAVAAGQNVVIVLPTRVYGPGHLKESNSLPALLYNYLNGRMPFMINHGVNIGNYVYIDDVVEGHWLAMSKGRSGERYILGGDNISLIELVERVDQLSGRRHFRISLGRRLPLAMAYFQLAAARLLGIHPLVTPGWMRMFMADGAFDCSKAQRELGLVHLPLAEGLRITFDWMGRVRPTKDHRRLAQQADPRSGS